jgi:hypothetical protein
MVYQCQAFQHLRVDPNLFSPGSVRDFMQRDPQAVVTFISESMRILDNTFRIVEQPVIG